ncbi:MAG: phosphoenolpyruvate synthase [Chloroflexi bacterium]|nr:phosphoenolpyruvate synthase [Chloroflexota bacterium]
MKTNYKDIVWFAEVDKKDIPLVGGKGANLGELTKTGIPVPPGFVVTSDSYFRFIEEAGLFGKINDILKPLNPDNGDQLRSAADEIKGLICNAKMPDTTSAEIRRAYRKLGGYVAVRSSATAEDLPEASFAGQQSTFLNIRGEDEVVTAVQMCWASLFESRAIFYRAHNNFDHLKVGIAVPVQRMVQSEISGVMFTVEPVSGNNQIVIEAVYGLGEAVVSGEVIPDLYVLDKETLAIKEKRIARQDWRLVRSDGKVNAIAEANIKQTIPLEDQEKQKLSGDEIVALAQLGKKIESVYQFPQDIEWAKEGDAIYIVQARPITTLKIVKNKNDKEVLNAPILLNGSAASPGLGSGPVKIIMNATEVARVEKGDVLVAEMTTPDFVPAMKRAAGIVTNRGGRTCHAAIVSRELGVPCVVGTGTATKCLRPGQMITVDGSQGRVYDGKVATKATSGTSSVKETVKTRTRLYVNLADPDLAEGVAARNVDGVGLLRAEFIVATHIGEHPRHILKEGRGEEFIARLAQGIGTFARAFSPRPVVYRTTDFKTNEYRNLKGGQEYEEMEENPMLGYRGCSRYINEPDIFKLEIEAIKRVRSNYKNLWVMLPFVRTVGELARTKRMLASEGLRQSPDFKLWMMVEIPSNIFLLDKFLDVGIDGISIGSNDLTQLTLGVDRDNQKLADDFDEQDEAVLMALEKAIKTAASKGVTSSICGQAPSFFPELVEKLVGWGITSVSVNPDAIERTRGNIAAAEQKLSAKR